MFLEAITLKVCGNVTTALVKHMAYTLCPEHASNQTIPPMLPEVLLIVQIVTYYKLRLRNRVSMYVKLLYLHIVLCHHIDVKAAVRVTGPSFLKSHSMNFDLEFWLEF